ncbi:hypothetical protein IFO70_08670 [Phormidium tenue FACHB-886]|nr:hypothetical protein [Phormidium tenue FACHB-886]
MAPSPQEQVKWVLRQSIDEALETAKDLAPSICLAEVRSQLLTIQSYCEAVGKVFIVVEESITCDRYGLGGCSEDVAVLFRGPKEDASVAICVTQKGSLLYRNSHAWRVYRDAGDINPVS